MRNDELKRKNIEVQLVFERSEYNNDNKQNIPNKHSNFDHVYLTLPLSNNSNYYRF